MTRAYKRRKAALDAEAEAAALAQHILAEAQGSGETTLPDGLYEALQLKYVLQRDLRKAVEKPIVVSVELFKNEWVFVVRGYNPPFDTWQGYAVYHIDSSNIGLR